MSKSLWTLEYELRASTRLLDPYLSTSEGMEAWLADRCREESENHFVLEWEGEGAYLYTRESWKPLKEVHYLVQPHGETSADPDKITFQLEESEMTGSVFILVSEESDGQTEDEFLDFWNSRLDALRETLGA